MSSGTAQHIAKKTISVQVAPGCGGGFEEMDIPMASKCFAGTATVQSSRAHRVRFTVSRTSRVPLFHQRG